jgi:hypothetical protein
MLGNVDAQGVGGLGMFAHRAKAQAEHAFKKHKVGGHDQPNGHKHQRRYLDEQLFEKWDGV